VRRGEKVEFEEGRGGRVWLGQRRRCARIVQRRLSVGGRAGKAECENGRGVGV
jgi:hypothetical protein